MANNARLRDIVTVSAVGVLIAAGFTLALAEAQKAHPSGQIEGLSKSLAKDALLTDRASYGDAALNSQTPTDVSDIR